MSRPPSDRNQNCRINSWSHVEEVFLVGAVMDRWFKRGSLSPTRKIVKVDCWEEIRQTYQNRMTNYSIENGLQFAVNRATTALSRRFKILKATSSKDLRNLYLEWEIKYNEDDFASVAKVHQVSLTKDNKRKRPCIVEPISKRSKTNVTTNTACSEAGSCSDSDSLSFIEEFDISPDYKIEESLTDFLDEMWETLE